MFLTIEHRHELRFCNYTRLLKAMYRVHRLRALVIRLVLFFEGSEFLSGTLRELLQHHHGVCVGAYSYGACLEAGAWPAGVTVGRYVSVGPNVQVFLRNHPMERLSMHPFFYNSALGFLHEDSISSGTLDIGHDAWIGANTIITPGCRRIGVGAVVGASSVVTKDVPDLAIVGGNPARLIRYRFNEEICHLIMESQWWEHSVDECVAQMPSMLRSLDDGSTLHPLLQGAKGRETYR